MTRSTLGRLFFATAIVAFGLLQLVMGGFVRLVPPLPTWIPSPGLWARLVGLVLVVLGLAIGTGRRARGAAAGLGLLILLDFLFLLLPQALANPRVGFLWTNPAKALALLGGALVLTESRKLRILGPLFLGGFMILGGIQHFVYADFVDRLVPGWIPGTRFWVYFTGVALVAGGLGLLVPKTRSLAATMSGIMIFLWVVLLHIPRALADLHDIGEASGVFEALAMSGIAFLLAEPDGSRPMRPAE